LFLRGLDDHEPDYAVFPGYTDELEQSMRRETELLFGDLLAGTLTLDQLLTADYTYVNAPLAAHYGLADAPADGFSKVSLAGTGRAGLLTHGAILTVTSYPTRTSPVKRGKWVLEQLLCEPPPPPPPGVEGLIQENMPSGSLRQRMEQHRANPTCAACHTQMDPIGFGLERYDGIGAFRDSDGGFAIDASGELPDGTAFSGAMELSALLAGDARFADCTAEQLLTYALGRGVTRHDEPHVSALSEAFAAAGYRLTALIEEIVLSDAFRARRGEDPATAQDAPSAGEEEEAP
jgi:hypothetical protein